AATVLIIGVFIPVVQTTAGAANQVRNRVLVDVFARTDATQAQVTKLNQELAQVKLVKHITYVSKQAAFLQQRKLDPAAYALLGSNPLPDTFRLTPLNPGDSNKLRAELNQSSPLGVRVLTDSTIASVRNSQAETNKILDVTRIVKLTMAALAVLLVIASVLLVSNTIRLSLFSRRREVEVMKLVGATDWFIRWPFVIEGLVLGALGGIAAVFLLTLAKVTIVDPLSSTFKLIATTGTINFELLIIVLMIAAVAVSAIGSGLSLRRFLRV
ncbi:MAG TPA: permease-like cell division protein FtsX, partial [Solirubrobacteraceae bacterium]|nr:permease-like cell division protein FtsX [Solirubrobacteraceae bacterium]